MSSRSRHQRTTNSSTNQRRDTEAHRDADRRLPAANAQDPRSQASDNAYAGHRSITAAMGRASLDVGPSNTTTYTHARDIPAASQPPPYIPRLAIPPAITSGLSVSTSISKTYQLGRVFQMLDLQQDTGQQARAGDAVIMKLRIFVVVAITHTHCLAAPVHTYSGRGVTKPGVRASDHVQIHCGSQAPPTLHGEHSLLHPPISVIPDGHAQLSAESRMNLAKLRTVEFNVKMRSIGMVYNVADLTNHVRAVWRDTFGQATPAQMAGTPRVPAITSSSQAAASIYRRSEGTTNEAVDNKRAIINRFKALLQAGESVDGFFNQVLQAMMKNQAEREARANLQDCYNIAYEEHNRR